MRTLVSMSSVRRSLAAKLFAAALVALIVSPVTAPFPTIGLAEIYGEVPFHSGCDATKLVQEVVELSGAAPALPQLNTLLLHQVTSPSDRPAGPSFHPLVLRI